MSAPRNDFMTETEIQSFLRDVNTASARSWIQGQDPKKGKKSFIHGRYDKIGNENYETIIDEWFKWFLTRQVGDLQETHLFSNTTYFLAPALPFQRPYHTRIIMHIGASLLVRIYCMSASFVEYPSLSDGKALLSLIKQDLSGIKWDAFEASLDEENIYGRCIIRKNPLKIDVTPSCHLIGFPQNRLREPTTLDIYHGGYWLWIRPDMLTAGDHLLYFKAFSKTYETEAKILINAAC
jgi:hypothetical protein